MPRRVGDIPPLACLEVHAVLSLPVSMKCPHTRQDLYFLSVSGEYFGNKLYGTVRVTAESTGIEL